MEDGCEGALIITDGSSSTSSCVSQVGMWPCMGCHGRSLFLKVSQGDEKKAWRLSPLCSKSLLGFEEIKGFHY